MKIMSIQGRNQMISHPHGMFMFDNVEDVVATLPLPSVEVLVGQIGVHIDQTAGAALFADNSLIRSHSSLLIPIFPDRSNHGNHIPKTL
jgi:hypothetical protein